MPTPMDVKLATRLVGATTAVRVTVLATTTCQRRGTAAIVAAIMREAYSRVPARQPITPIRRTPNTEPVRTVATGSLLSNVAGPALGALTEPVDTAAASAANATSRRRRREASPMSSAARFV